MYKCRSCQAIVSEEDLAKQMVSGCTQCGNRVFRICKDDAAPKSPEEIRRILEKQVSDDIAIHVRDRGQYAVNLKALVSRDSGMDPILIQDKTGKISVLLNPDPK
jgi:predicted  nucleic acid-binding Zn-ribbon protein